jgi:hypothetical protein
MAIELRCPDCGSKLRLPEAPEPGTEIECPKCTHVFTARAPDEDDRPRKRPAEADEKPAEENRDGVEAPKKKKLKKKDMPRKKRAKKKETNPMMLVLLCVFALMFVGILVTGIALYFSRKPAAYEMMTYVPEDAHSVAGLNYYHCTKYPEFFKQVDGACQGRTFKKLADALAKAVGGETSDVLDYVLYSETKSGDVIVLRTQKEIDTGLLSKLPGARKQPAINGQEYYLINDVDGAGGFTQVRVFAPTNRIVVFCPGSIPDGVFRKMLAGDADSDKAMVKRMGPLGKEVTKGTWWGFRLIDGNLNKPVPPAPPGAGQQGSMVGNSGDQDVQKIAAEAAGNAKGYGFKISVGSRTTRFTAVVWHRDEDAAKGLYDKFKDSDVVKAADDASLDPPRWWKAYMSGFGDKRVGNNLLTNAGAKRRGELFILYSEVDTKDVMSGIGSIVNKIIPTPPQLNSGNAPGPPGGPQNGPAGPQPGVTGPQPGPRGAPGP